MTGWAARRRSGSGGPANPAGCRSRGRSRCKDRCRRAALHHRHDESPSPLRPGTAATATAPHRRQRFSAGADMSVVDGLPRPSTWWTIAPGDGLNDELRDRPAIGGEHQDQHQHVPQPEAVERGGHARGRVQRQRIAHRAAAIAGIATAYRAAARDSRRTAAALASSITPPIRLTTTHGPHQAISGSE